MRVARVLAALALAGCTSASGVSSASSPVAAPASDLRRFVDSLIDVPEFRSTHWGVLIVDAIRGDTLYSRNADKLFMPASNMKLVTGATALAQLGRDYRWTTTLLARGPIRDGVLEGDLVVRGTGDPTVSASMQRGDALAPLRAMGDSLRARGITRVRGSVVAAPSPFTDATLGFGWAWDDLDEPYSAGVDALYFNEGFTTIIVRGGARAGDPVTATTRPASSFPRLIVRARTVAALRPGATGADSATARTWLAVSQDSSRAGVLVSGTIAAGDSSVQTIAFRDQSGAYVLALREALASRGITIDGVASDTMTTLTPMVDPIVAIQSATLGEVLPYFEKPSQNQIGELLFKTIALERTGVGRADSAAAVVARQLLAWGATADGFAVRDGSGLSRHDYITPRTTVVVLDAMRRHADFQLFYDALPVAGVDGTIRNRMRGTPATGNLHAKTGTLDKARSLSGYVTTADGRLLLFSALCNNYVVPTRRVDAVTDAIGIRLASMRLGRY